jgi:hypothetical protein
MWLEFNEALITNNFGTVKAEDTETKQWEISQEGQKDCVTLSDLMGGPYRSVSSVVSVKIYRNTKLQNDLIAGNGICKAFSESNA